MSNPSDEKLGLALRFLNEPGGSVLVHFRTDAVDVVVPDHLRDKPTLVFQFGKNLAIPVVDLDVSRLGISGGLSFGGTKYFCRVPWLAVYAIADVNDKGYVWAENAPTWAAARDKMKLVRGEAKLTTPARGVLRRVQ